MDTLELPSLISVFMDLVNLKLDLHSSKLVNRYNLCGTIRISLILLRDFLYRLIFFLIGSMVSTNFNLNIVHVFVSFIVSGDQLNLVSTFIIIANFRLIKSNLIRFFVVTHEMF